MTEFKHETVVDGEPIYPKYVGNNEWIYNLECCDCGLSHFFLFAKKGKTLRLRAFRDTYSTNLNRRKKK